MSRENEVARQIVDACFHAHREMGPGVFEKVYEQVLEYEFRTRGMAFERQVALPIVYKGVKLEDGFRCDFIVERCVVLELKCIEGLAPVHFKQVLTYLRLGGFKLGILVNFNEPLIKTGIHRIVNNL